VRLPWAGQWFAALIIGSVTPVAELSSDQSDALGSFTASVLTIVLESRRNHSDDRLYSATRPNAASPFSTPCDADFMNILVYSKRAAGSPRETVPPGGHSARRDRPRLLRLRLPDVADGNYSVNVNTT